MRFTKLSSALGALALGVALMTSSAQALPIPITPGGPTVALTGGPNAYSYTSPNTLATSGQDVFSFSYAGGVQNPASNDTSINPKFSASPNSFTSFVVSWLFDNTVLTSHTMTLNEFGTTISIPLPNLADGISHVYKLVVDWTKAGPSTAVYDTVIQTTPAGGPGEVPLPPAALLFVSALAGMGLLGRRRMKAAKQ